MGNVIYTPKTELHTHFLEILNSQDFFDFLLDYDICIPLNKNNIIDLHNGEKVHIKEINNEQKNAILSQLSLEKGTVNDFSRMNDIIITRSELLNICISTYECWKNDADYALALGVYNLLKRSLISLRSMNIKYTEISYSNARIVRILNELINNDPNKVEGIHFNILMGINRNRSESDYRKSAKRYAELLTYNFVCGCDIVGYERPIDKTEKSIYMSRLYHLLDAVKRDEKNGVLRLHSGEFPGIGNSNNTEILLSTFDRIEREKNIEILPTEIRIGHGINIQRTESLAELLKRYSVIIEFNITSNYTLGNINKEERDIYKRVLDFYIDNSVPVVLGTDGSGIYCTTPQEEICLAESLMGDRVDYIRKCDYEICERKLTQKSQY